MQALSTYVRVPWPVLRRGASLFVLVLLLSLSRIPACVSQTPDAMKAGPVVTFPDAPTVRLNVTGVKLVTGTLSQATEFLTPVGNAVDRQDIQIEVQSAQPQPVTFAETFKADYGLPLPTSTRGNNEWDLWGFRFHRQSQTWHLYARTPPPMPAASPRREERLR